MGFLNLTAEITVSAYGGTHTYNYKIIVANKLIQKQNISFYQLIFSSILRFQTKITYLLWPLTNYGHVMSRKVSYLKQAKLFSSKSFFFFFCDPSSKFLINRFLTKTSKPWSPEKILYIGGNFFSNFVFSNIFFSIFF